MKTTITLLMLVFAMMSAQAMALECYSESPTLAEAENIFEHKPPTELTRKQQKQLKKLFDKLEGEWEGREVSFDCVGSETNARKRILNKTLTIDVEKRSDSSARINSEIYSEERRTTRYEHFRLFVVDDYLRLDGRSAAGDIELLLVESGRVSFLSRYFIRNRKVISLDELEHPELGILPAIRDSIVSILPIDDSDEVSIQPIDPENSGDVSIQPIDPENSGDVSIQPVDESGDVRIQPVPEERVRERNREIEYLAGGALKEVVRTIRLNGRSMNIDITTYTNGYLSSSYQWSVRR